jgi:hypothetical protein
VGNGGILRGLRASLGFFAVAVDVVIDRSAQAESAKLDRGAVDLVAGPGHADRLELIQHAARVMEWSAGSGLGAGPCSLVLLLRSRERSGICARRGDARIP